MNDNPYSVGQGIDSDKSTLQGLEFDGAVRGMQIVAAALMMGVLIFLGVVLIATEGNLTGKPELLTMMGAGFGFLGIVNCIVIPGMISKAHLKQAAAGLLQKTEQEKVNQVIGAYRSQMIVGLALLEGAAFFNLTAMIVDHCAASIAVVVLLMGLMLVKFPTRDKVSFWVQDKLRELQM